MTPKTVAIGVVLVLGGALLGMNADALWGGPYALSAGGNQVVWRMNQRTGQVSVCLFEGDSADLKAARMTPQCSPWGPATER